MKPVRRRGVLWLGVITSFLLMVLVPVSVIAQVLEESIDIQVSPNTLNLENEVTPYLTVHTSISFSAVNGATVELCLFEGDVGLGCLNPAWSKSDAQGNYVGKFTIEDIKEMVKGMNDQIVTFVLAGEKKGDGDVFSGADDILVINVAPAGQQ